MLYILTTRRLLRLTVSFSCHVRGSFSCCCHLWLAKSTSGFLWTCFATVHIVKSAKQTEPLWMKCSTKNKKRGRFVKCRYILTVGSIVAVYCNYLHMLSYFTSVYFITDEGTYLNIQLCLSCLWPEPPGGLVRYIRVLLSAPKARALLQVMHYLIYIHN